LLNLLGKLLRPWRGPAAVKNLLPTTNGSALAGEFRMGCVNLFDTGNGSRKLGVHLRADTAKDTQRIGVGLVGNHAIDCLAGFEERARVRIEFICARYIEHPTNALDGLLCPAAKVHALALQPIGDVRSVNTAGVAQNLLVCRA
jgi:hypothetical protein